MKNLMAKTRPQDRPYEIWEAPGFEWRVLKKWQADDHKPGARWFCATKGPGTFGTYELGDGYAADIMSNARRTYRDPSIPEDPSGPVGEIVSSAQAQGKS